MEDHGILTYGIILEGGAFAPLMQERIKECYDAIDILKKTEQKPKAQKRKESSYL